MMIPVTGSYIVSSKGRRARRICVISGFSDIEAVGNQSMKNNIRYLAEFGYSITVWSFFPNGFPNLLDPATVFEGKIEFRRLPGWTCRAFTFAKWFKNTVSKVKLRGAVSANHAVEYYGDDNGLGRLLHILFLLLVYIPVEALRVGIWHLRRPADIFYGINWQGAVVAALLGKVFGKPVITRFHGTSVKERDLIGLRGRLWVLDEYIGMKVPSDAIVMTNDGTRGNRILKLLNVDERKIHFWMNGLDMDDLRLPHDWNPDELKDRLGLHGKVILLTVSRLSLWKRVDRSVRSIHTLITGNGIRDVVLLIIGDGPERARLEQLSRNLEIKESVRFLGGIPHKQIGGYYSIADIFLALSDVSNLGNPLLEALYFGVPIITLEDGSTSELLRNGYDSFLVDVGAVAEGVSGRIKALLEDELLRKEIGQNAKATFKEKVLSWKERMLLENKLLTRVCEESKGV